MKEKKWQNILFYLVIVSLILASYGCSIEDKLEENNIEADEETIEKLKEEDLKELAIKALRFKTKLPNVEIKMSLLENDKYYVKVNHKRESFNSAKSLLKTEAVNILYTLESLLENEQIGEIEYQTIININDNDVVVINYQIENCELDYEELKDETFENPQVLFNEAESYSLHKDLEKEL